MKLTKEEERRIQKEIEEKIINLFEEDFKIETNYINKTKVLKNEMKIKKRRLNYFNSIAFEILPYNLEKMDKENIGFLLTNYSIISLLNNNKSKNEDKYSITSSLVVNLTIGDKTVEDAISYVVDKINLFFNQVNIPIVIFEHKNMNKQYEKTFIMEVKNKRNKVTNISEISILSKSFLNDLGLSKQMQDKIIFTLNFNEKLIEYYEEFN